MARGRLLIKHRQTGTRPAVKPHEIFVFGSNLAGRHGKGAALTAMRRYGAQRGIGVGASGQSYAIPTKNAELQRLPLWAIAMHVNQFIEHAWHHPEQSFYVTRIGCGLAGYTDTDIAPLFSGAPFNVKLPEGWKP